MQQYLRNMAGRPTLHYQELALRQEEGLAAQTIPHWPVRHPWLGCVHYLFYFIRNYLVQQQQQLHHQQQQQQRDAEQMPLPPTDAGAAPAAAPRCFILPLQAACCIHGRIPFIVISVIQRGCAWRLKCIKVD